ncbi:MAG TPA: AAA family ATPase [Ramlibacter sp.]|nr:AAA family ATPase [Ramlibacter sp.]
MDASQIQSRIAARSERLRQVREELKSELFGIDAIIDRVIEAVRAWYVLPEIIQRPVIVCLWGLTGTGKTQLVRLLAQKLGFYDRFVEVQMDGFSHGSGYWRSSISGMLSDSGIEEGAPGVLLLDEFQRFRTMNDKGADLKVERYQDVWALLSDGRLPPMLSFMNDLEASLAGAEYDRDRERREEAEDEVDEPAARGEGAPQRKFRRRFLLTPSEAAELKRSLKLPEPLLEIMAWEPQEVRARIQAFREQPERWGTDYSRLLVFVAGNLDEMYRHVATRVEDCDTDADIFHQFTSRLSLIDAKKALGERFKPEQIARLGNNHLVYPSLDRRTYERLILEMCTRYAAEVGRTSRLRIEIDPRVREEIYANGVFPAQGTRPLFSSVQALLSATLVNAALWALEEGAQPGDALHLGMADDRRHLRAAWSGRSRAFAVPFELNRLKQRTNADFRALLAVHEAGHALLYGLLLKQVPLEVKINVASFNGGYNSFLPLKVQSRRDVLDMICVGLGGRAAETLVFGPAACTTGAEQDLLQATAEAAQFVRTYGFGERLSRTDVARNEDCQVNTSIADTDAGIERLLAAQFNRAQLLLQENAQLLARLADALTRDGEVPRAALAALLGLEVAEEPAVVAPYAERLAQFTALQL